MRAPSPLLALVLAFATGCSALFDTDMLDFGDAEVVWVEIDGDTYLMGDPAAAYWEAAYPVHAVAVPDFELTRTEITVGQYARCVRAGDCREPDDLNDTSNWALGISSLPVTAIPWEEAVAFCDWAGGRLPSEAEWEYAARSEGEDDPYPWGDDDPACDLVIMSTTRQGCGTGRSWPVCSRTAGQTDQGLCDMSGNVAEWVADAYHVSYGGAPTDGSAWSSSDDPELLRVVRGGSYASEEVEELAVHDRRYAPGDEAGDNVGFRCAR